MYGLTGAEAEAEAQDKWDCLMALDLRTLCPFAEQEIRDKHQAEVDKFLAKLKTQRKKPTPKQIEKLDAKLAREIKKFRKARGEEPSSSVLQRRYDYLTEIHGTRMQAALSIAVFIRRVGWHKIKVKETAQ